MSEKCKPTPKRLDIEKLSDFALLLEAELKSRVIGQDRAVNQLVRVYETFNAGMQAPRRPLANLLFLGPTGSGKTRLVEALAESLFGAPDVGIVKIDCGEFIHDHEISKLLGSPPGYIGHDKAESRLSQRRLEKHLIGRSDLPQISIVLFDEIEKAAQPEFSQLLLGIMDKGILNLGNGDVVDFSRTVIVMTSNLGSQSITRLLSGRQLGFHNTSDCSHDDIDQRIYMSSMEAVRRSFSAEFVGRLDRVIVFRPLDEASLWVILNIELDAIQKRLVDKFILLSVSDKAKEFLLKEGVSPTEGARGLKKAVERFVVTKLSSLIATKQIQAGDRLIVDREDGTAELIFSVLENAIPVFRPPVKSEEPTAIIKPEKDFYRRGLPPWSGIP